MERIEKQTNAETSFWSNKFKVGHSTFNCGNSKCPSTIPLNCIAKRRVRYDSTFISNREEEFEIGWKQVGRIHCTKISLTHPKIVTLGAFTCSIWLSLKLMDGAVLCTVNRLTIKLCQDPNQHLHHVHLPVSVIRYFWPFQWSRINFSISINGYILMCH